MIVRATPRGLFSLVLPPLLPPTGEEHMDFLTIGCSPFNHILYYNCIVSYRCYKEQRRRLDQRLYTDPTTMPAIRLVCCLIWITERFRLLKKVILDTIRLILSCIIFLC